MSYCYPELIDICTQQMFDTSGSASINWNNRTLYDKTGSSQIGGLQSLSWQNRLGYDFIGTESINWGSRTLFDNNQSQSIIWENRSLYGAWTCDTPGISPTSLVTISQTASIAGGGGSFSLPIQTTETPQHVLLAPNGALILGIDSYNQPFIQEPINGFSYAFDPYQIPIITAATNYGVLKIEGLGENGSGSEASIAYFGTGTGNGSPNYWVAGINIGNDVGNGNFNFYNSANNVVYTLTPTGDVHALNMFLTGSLSITDGVIIDINTSSSIDTNYRYLIDSDGTATSINWDNRTLYHTDGTTPMLNWSGSHADIPSINTNLITGTNNGYVSTVLDVPNRILKDGNGVSIINFQANSAYGDTTSLLTLDSNANQVTVNAARLQVSGSLSVQSPIITNGVQAVADGTYTMGIGNTLNGTITIVNGIITVIQQAS
jgi:hypothetical protein